MAVFMMLIVYLYMSVIFSYSEIQRTSRTALVFVKYVDIELHIVVILTCQ